MKKIFVSVPMHGREDLDVLKDIEKATKMLQDKYGENNVSIINNLFHISTPEKAGRLWYLGRAIQKLDGCDACYFVEGWEQSKGCIVEHDICKTYGIECLYDPIY